MASTSRDGHATYWKSFENEGLSLLFLVQFIETVAGMNWVLDVVDDNYYLIVLFMKKNTLVCMHSMYFVFQLAIAIFL